MDEKTIIYGTFIYLSLEIISITIAIIIKKSKLKAENTNKTNVFTKLWSFISLKTVWAFIFTWLTLSIIDTIIRQEEIPEKSAEIAGTITVFIYLLLLPCIMASRQRNKAVEELRKFEQQQQEQIEKIMAESETENHDEPNKGIIIEQPKTEWKNCYEPRYILTVNEKYAYRKINNWAKTKQYTVLLKVRMADLVAPRSDQYNKIWLFRRIQSKHLDFVIINDSLDVIGIVELQDASHNAPDRQERDQFVKEVLESCGYKILFTYAPSEEELNLFCNTT